MAKTENEKRQWVVNYWNRGREKQYLRGAGIRKGSYAWDWGVGAVGGSPQFKEGRAEKGIGHDAMNLWAQTTSRKGLHE